MQPTLVADGSTTEPPETQSERVGPTPMLRWIADHGQLAARELQHHRHYTSATVTTLTPDAERLFRLSWEPISEQDGAHALRRPDPGP